MTIIEIIKQFWQGLLKRRRLSLLNTRDNHEVWHTHVSPMNILSALVAVVVLLFIIILTLVGYTPILEVLPGYSAEAHRSRQEVIDNIVRLDSMERVIDEMMLYTDNVALIMEGKSPVVRASQQSDTTLLAKELIAPSGADSAIRREMEGESRYNLEAAASVSKHPIQAPVDGVITGQFDIAKGEYGVKVATSADSRVMAALGGTVTLSLWSPESGFTITVMHSDNTLSIYQNIPSSIVERGDKVGAGEVIGYSGITGESEYSKGKNREIGFELWIDGRPVDPERYIIF